MKKTFALILALTMCVGMLAACGGSGSSTPQASQPEGSAPSAGGVELTVVTSYGQEDGNRANFVEAVDSWMAETGNTVLENSSTSDETWKAQVLNDFEAGADPDVLLFFAFADADPLINGDKVVSLDEIRAEYPDYASNMDENKLLHSTADGKVYTVPTHGYWEGLFYNKTVLEAAGVEAPGPNTTWDEFIVICQKIKDAGYTPIAIGSDIPHYWFEFLILNAGGIDSHLTLPTADDEGASARDNWINGLEGFRELYELGFFPDNYLTLGNEEAKALVADGDAAFIGEGSWTVGWFDTNADPDEIGVCYVPGTEASPASEIISGLSMGYYITRKAWDDPAKREAAVSFISHLTSDEVISKMTITAVGSNALKTSPEPQGLDTLLRRSAYELTAGATGIVGAVQDIAAGAARDALFTSDIPQIATGGMTSEAAVDKWIEAFYS